MRIDKFLHAMRIGTRTQVRRLIKDGHISANGERVLSGKQQVNPVNDAVFLDDEQVRYQQYFYYVMNKPVGAITATTDATDKTVLDLFNKTDYRDDLFPVGRLDKDTEGILLITNDGGLSHALVSPAHHVTKVYEAEVTGEITADQVAGFNDGLTLKDGTELQPAQAEIVAFHEIENFTTIRMMIHEGKYHQVKRMIGTLGERVVQLKRIKFGSLTLPVGLLAGNYRALTDDELVALKADAGQTE
ncbi:16S rRNA pseudouridine(516) synthase [Lactiplantibacillus mudanjiangensis]|uniref:Pseudouridine synthase n=1 Tax=Lactiplantibacillus mudanjiangensis TaxID=1296538 RepID=A0A660E6Y2_9LACO|nr:16S rRNA pseudouridine(516) synthase [Lactiplantibacillus mudanjiangensis]VDG18493.1 pseudouridylate synthase [Lactobacillus plantarum JDM1] [Lactiplantibacillus mudanjiangensis]VDG25915.1 pseudouridylate synthase [Lactobacillus plantarum JDM1] [Lactiplantibacillus mudanjiangensis]VDG28859.1 pseudouridylate synthase [Lactobacillus plantarum JDM1] [Lactiplantibacillus mudanjiangensis]VDG33747.1 pseudouridylate synthase [Lactobacillus plantarum JDM1] [Lactiplantibacillus mudanjiangensis]